MMRRFLVSIPVIVLALACAVFSLWGISPVLTESARALLYSLSLILSSLLAAVLAGALFSFLIFPLRAGASFLASPLRALAAVPAPIAAAAFALLLRGADFQIFFSLFIVFFIRFAALFTENMQSASESGHYLAARSSGTGRLRAFLAYIPASVFGGLYAKTARAGAAALVCEGVLALLGIYNSLSLSAPLVNGLNFSFAFPSDFKEFLSGGFHTASPFIHLSLWAWLFAGLLAAGAGAARKTPEGGFKQWIKY